MTYLTAFPDFDAHEDVATLLAQGFEDVSGHNNTCPSFQRGTILIFCDYLSPSLREFGGDNDDRFSIHREDDSDDAGHLSDARTLAEALIIAASNA